MNYLFAVATLEDIDKAVGLLTEKIDTLIELLKGTQGNTQYYIAGVVGVTLISAIGVLWKAYASKEKDHKVEMAAERKQSADTTKVLVDELRESSGETIKALESKSDALIESGKLISEMTSTIKALQTAVEKIQPPGTAPAN